MLKTLAVSLRRAADQRGMLVGLRVYAPDAEDLLAGWQRHWPFPEIKLLGHRWAEPDMEDVFTAYSQGYVTMLDEETIR